MPPAGRRRWWKLSRRAARRRPRSRSICAALGATRSRGTGRSQELGRPLADAGRKRPIAPVVNQAALVSSARVPSPELPAAALTLLGEDRATLAAEAAGQEAQRCANCGCVAVNASDLAPALVALDAQIKTTQRTLGVEELFGVVRNKTTMLEVDELIMEIEIPVPPPGSRQQYLKFRLRNAIDFPIVSLAFCLTLEAGQFHDTRIVLGAVAPVLLRGPRGRGPVRGPRARRCPGAGSPRAGRPRAGRPRGTAADGEQVQGGGAEEPGQAGGGDADGRRAISFFASLVSLANCRVL
jgi:hypothetical protein